ncbi:MAG: DUF3592 domain-containing protein [Defluviitaleaceae bacterium]|nr:DUF3592 domain-containing protein [Defluviitaleaceae bacterium]
MHKKAIKIIGIVFLSVGLLMGIIAFILFATIGHNHRRVAGDSYRVTATIVELNIGPGIDGSIGRVYVEYEAGGVTITAPLRWSSTNMFVGQHVDILVSRQNPHEFVNTWPFYWIPVGILLGMAIIFGGLGIGFLIYERRKGRKFQWLLEYGIPVWANVLGTEENWRIQINGRPATVLTASYGNMQFTSGPVDNNDLMTIGEHVKVLLDPDDATKYVFDFHNDSYLMPDKPPTPLAGSPNTN